MKKRILSLALALIMCLSLVPMTALAAEVSATAQGVTITIDKSNYQHGEKIYYAWSGVTDAHAAGVLWGELRMTAAGSEHRDYIDNDYADREAADFSNVVYFTAPNTDGAYEIRFYWGASANASSFVLSVPFTVGNVKTGSISVAQTELTANTYITVDYSGITDEMVSADAFVGIFKPGAEHDVNKVASGDGDEQVTAGAGQVTLHTPNINGKFELRLYNTLYHLTADNLMMTLPITLSGATASEWALAELQEAEELGLIPDVLQGADLTKGITRAEFAAVCVKVYENLAETTATVASPNPFTDTADAEVLKAYNVGVTNGKYDGGTRFAPAEALTRQEAATMLTRVYKRVTVAGWTLATDSQFPLTFTAPVPFADDAHIDAWAKNSVYFMAANGIIGGMGGNKFAPKNTTTAESAVGYANATRQQALLIAVRMVKNLDV